MKPRARRARAALRGRRTWDLAHLVAAQPHLIIALQDAQRLRPVRRARAARLIHTELVHRIFPEGL